MEDAQFSREFFDFLREKIPSVDAAEILLLLYRNPGRPFSPSETLERLGPVLSEGEVREILQRLADARLVAGANATFVYSPATPELAAHVKLLSAAYEERPVTLFRLISALRKSPVQTLADAFKIRKS